MGWSEERVEMVKQLWKEGLSASQIAGRIGNVTRNAVIGKVHRMGLSGRKTVHRKRQKPRRMDHNKRRNRFDRNTVVVRAKKSPVFLQAEPLPEFAELEIPQNERKSLLALDDRGCDCRWGIGDPQHADFHFCNRAAVPGLSYCEFHARRAFQPPRPATGREFVRFQRMSNAAVTA